MHNSLVRVPSDDDSIVDAKLSYDKCLDQTKLQYHKLLFGLILYLTTAKQDVWKGFDDKGIYVVKWKTGSRIYTENIQLMEDHYDT